MRQAQFQHIKTSGEERLLIVNLPKNLSAELKNHIGERQSEGGPGFCWYVTEF